MDRETPNLVACRSHFFVCYLAYAEIAMHASNDDFGNTSMGIFTAFDGGGGANGYSPAQDRMWHCWGLLKDDSAGHSAEDNMPIDPPIEWVMMVDGEFFHFEFTLERTMGQDNWPSVGFKELIELLLKEWKKDNLTTLEELRRSSSALVPSDSAIKEAKRLENRHFSNFGQGNDVLFS